MPTFFSASGSLIPCLSTSPSASFISRLPEHAEEPNKLLPNRAPSSSAQSTNRTVTGGLPPYCALMRRRISTPAITLRQPSSQPPFFGHRNQCARRSRRHFSDSPRSAGPQIPRRIAIANFHRQALEPFFWYAEIRGPSSHVGVKATRCAPVSSPVSARSSLSSAMVRFGFRDAFMQRGYFFPFCKIIVANAPKAS